jgi:hypothetical protein
MRAGSAGAATLRHVGLVALEATLVATLVWIAAMTLAGAGQSNDLVGAANAGRDPGTVLVKPAVHGATALVSTTNAPDGAWVHVQCAQGSTLVMSTWARLDPRGRAKVVLSGGTWTSGAADCLAQVGSFTQGGRWRVDAESRFGATGT